MRQSFVLTFENGLPKGTAQQKGETVRYKNGKPFVFHYKKSSVESAHQLFAYKLKPYAPSTPITGCVALSVTLFFSVKERAKWGKYKPSRPDADNYCKELVDVMGSLGWWLDDAQIVKLKIEKRYAEKASIFIHCEEVFDDVIQYDRSARGGNGMTDIKQAIELLERMTAEPAPGEDARLDADELDAVLYAVKILKGEEKPRGTWIKADIVTFGAFYDWVYKCSICDGHSKGTTNYCPYCGALMEKEATT